MDYLRTYKLFGTSKFIQLVQGRQHLESVFDSRLVASHTESHSKADKTLGTAQPAGHLKKILTEISRLLGEIDGKDSFNISRWWKRMYSRPDATGNLKVGITLKFEDCALETRYGEWLDAQNLTVDRILNRFDFGTYPFLLWSFCSKLPFNKLVLVPIFW